MGSVCVYWSSLSSSSQLSCRNLDYCSIERWILGLRSTIILPIENIIIWRYGYEKHLITPLIGITIPIQACLVSALSEPPNFPHGVESGRFRRTQPPHGNHHPTSCSRQLSTLESLSVRLSVTHARTGRRTSTFLGFSSLHQLSGLRGVSPKREHCRFPYFMKLCVTNSTIKLRTRLEM